MDTYQSRIKSPTNPLFPPAANTLRISSFNGVPYRYRWSVGIETEISPAADEVGEPGDENFSPARPAVIEYNELRCDNAGLSQEQWDAWTVQPNKSYLLSCAAETLGLELDS